MKDFLTRRRHVTVEWYLDQAQQLLELAKKMHSATALVYSALEIRNAIERFVIEMSIVAKGGVLTDEQVRVAHRKDGAFQLLENAMSAYRKHIEFTNMILAINGAPFGIALPDIKTFKRLRTSLSQYCHFQLDPAKTVDHAEDQWFLKGEHSIKEAIALLSSLLQQPIGAINRESMPKEAQSLFDKYLSDEIDSKSARIQLKLMQPIFERRLLVRSLVDGS